MWKPEYLGTKDHVTWPNTTHWGHQHEEGAPGDHGGCRWHSPCSEPGTFVSKLVQVGGGYGRMPQHGQVADAHIVGCHTSNARELRLTQHIGMLVLGRLQGEQQQQQQQQQGIAVGEAACGAHRTEPARWVWCLSWRAPPLLTLRSKLPAASSSGSLAWGAGGVSPATPIPFDTILPLVNLPLDSTASQARWLLAQLSVTAHL
jgi:hypothetical protein